MNNSLKYIIQSLLDTDLYKFTMMQTAYHQFPHAKNVKYNFKCRTKNIDLAQFMNEINKEIDHLCTISLTPDELKFLSKNYMQPDFIDFLANFKLKREHIKLVALENGEIDVVISGPWVQTILFEVPVLAIINEVYFRHIVTPSHIDDGQKLLNEKIQLILESSPGFKFVDMGTRRRNSRIWQEHVISELVKHTPNNMIGTSNVYLAMKYNLKAVGTMAHEYLQACQVLGGSLVDSQKFAFETWLKEYRGYLSIALTDVVGVDAFLRDFDYLLSKSYDGVRHDSGCPYAWADKMIAHYKKFGIDSKNKTFVFSDGLDFPKAIDLYQKYHEFANVLIGIGTNLTNDLGIKPLSIVIKMTECNGQPVAKLSDDAGKTMCKDAAYLAYLKETFKIDNIQNNVEISKPKLK